MSDATMEPLLRVRNLRVSFRLDRHHHFEAVKGISFDVPHHATVALVGESGSGKSVTSLAILGLLPPENATVTAGSEILYGGRNLVGLPPGAGEIGMIVGAMPRRSECSECWPISSFWVAPVT